MVGDADAHVVPGGLPQVGGGGGGAPVGALPHHRLERSGHTGHHRPRSEAGGWGPAFGPVLRRKPARGRPGNARLSTSLCVPAHRGGVLGHRVRLARQHPGSTEPGPTQGPQAVPPPGQGGGVRVLLHAAQRRASYAPRVRDCAEEQVGGGRRSEQDHPAAEHRCLLPQVPDDMLGGHRVHQLGADAEDVCRLAQVLHKLLLP